MGHDEAADLLQETLDEEKAADEKLNTLAEGASTNKRPKAHSRVKKRKRSRRRWIRQALILVFARRR
jgi:hypothetical protein